MNGSGGESETPFAAPGGAADGALVFRSVLAHYPGSEAPALRECSFRLDAGERLALIGPNGSGKSTVLLATVGLVPHKGEILVGGIPVERASLQRVRARIGFLFANPEDQILFPRVEDDVAFSLTARGIPTDPARARAREALDRLGAGDLAERSPYQMSHGQRLRAALAGVLVGEPPLLLLDEPTSGLDSAGRRLLAADLAALPAAMLIATHDLEFARSCCHGYLRMEDGRVASAGSDFDHVEPPSR